jgi:hypothetical protein
MITIKKKLKGKKIEKKNKSKKMTDFFEKRKV